MFIGGGGASAGRRRGEEALGEREHGEGEPDRGAGLEAGRAGRHPRRCERARKRCWQGPGCKQAEKECSLGMVWVGFRGSRDGCTRVIYFLWQLVRIQCIALVFVGVLWHENAIINPSVPQGTLVLLRGLVLHLAYCTGP